MLSVTKSLRQRDPDGRITYINHFAETLYGWRKEEEGVELAEAFRPARIVLDIGLPKLNGYDACRRILGRRPRGQPAHGR